MALWLTTLPHAAAGAVELSGQWRSGVEYNSNWTFSSRDAIAAPGLRQDLDLVADIGAERVSARASLTGGYRAFLDARLEDLSEYAAEANVAMVGPVAQTALVVSGDMRDSILGVFDEAAQIGVDDRERRYRAALSRQQALGERLGVGATVQVQRVDFDDDGPSGRIDFDVVAANANVNLQASERLALTGRLNANHVSSATSSGFLLLGIPVVNRIRSTTLLAGPGAGVDYALNERQRLQLDVDVRWQNSTMESAFLLADSTQDERGWALFGGARYLRELDRGQLSLGYQRDFRPSSSAGGQVRTRDALSGSLRWALATHWSATANLSVARDRAGGRTQSDLTTFSLEAGLRWRFRERWTAAANARVQARSRSGAETRRGIVALSLARSFDLDQ